MIKIELSFFVSFRFLFFWFSVHFILSVTTYRVIQRAETHIFKLFRFRSSTGFVTVWIVWFKIITKYIQKKIWANVNINIYGVRYARRGNISKIFLVFNVRTIEKNSKTLKTKLIFFFFLSINLNRVGKT